MMKNYLWFFLGLLCPLGSLFSQVTVVTQTPIPIAEVTDIVTGLSTINNPSLYQFHEVLNHVQGVSINLPQPVPPTPHEIHLQSGNSQLRFTSLFNADNLTYVELIYDNSTTPVVLLDVTAQNAVNETNWTTPPVAFQTIGEHELIVNYEDENGDEFTRSFIVFYTPASDGYFEDSFIAGVPWTDRNSLTRYSNPTCSDARPILIVEGFDPPNTLYPEFYRQRGDYMAEKFFELRYDIFILNFQLNAQSMANNAAVVQAAVAFLSDLYEDELVALVGVSMGGIISRLAATRTEDAGTALPISMLVTMDSPHQGAVIDAEFQDILLEIDDNSFGQTQLAQRAVGNPAAQELLIYNTTNQNQLVHNLFYGILNSLNGGEGYPLEVPTIGVAFSPFSTASNPHSGDAWLEVDPSLFTVGILQQTFEVQQEWAELGSFLPRRTSNIPEMGFDAANITFNRSNHPTFIRTTSALDIMNGTPSMRYGVYSNAVSFHDQIPQEAVDRVFNRLYSFSPTTIASGKFYNFTRQVGSVIRRDMDVFGTLRVNESGYSGFSDDPDPGSSFTSYSIRTQNCKPITVDVQSGGIFHLGEGGSRTSTVRIQEGSSVILESGSTLKIDDNSTLIIEPGATFRVEQGASIQLLGSNAVLQIEGDLILGPGATFGFTGAGFVRLGLPDQPGGLYPNVILDGNGPHGIAFLGSGPTDKVLEIMSDTYLGPDYDLDVFSIQGGRVELGEDASINTGYADLTLQNAHFTAIDTDQRFKTIFGNGQANHTIDQVEIDHADIGINWRGIQGDNASLTMTDSDIHDCGIGIQTTGRSAILDGVDLVNVNTGWHALFHSGSGSYSDGQIDILGAASIWQQGSGHIHVQSSDLQNGLAGILNQGTGASSVTCSDITGVNTGIAQSLGGWIALDNQRNNKINGSWRSLSLDDSWFPLLYQGKNGLLGTGSSQAVFGTIFYPALVLAADNNQWNSNIPNPIPAGPNPGTSPTSPADYVLSSPQGAVILSDPGPTAWQACGSGNSGISAEWVAACSECPTIATSSYEDVRLDLAINDAMNLLYDSNHEYLAPVAAAYRFHEILTAGYSYTASVTSLLDLVAFRFREAVEAGIAMDSIDTNPAIHSPSLSGLPGLLSDALGIWIAECENQDRDLPAFYLSADRALIWDWVGQPAEASSDLQDLRSEATGDNRTWLDNWTCYLDIRDDILNHQITPEVADSLLDLCVALPAPNLSGNNNARFGLGVPSRTSGTNTEDPFRAYPNPAEGRLLVEGSLSSDRSVSIRLLSMAGQAIELMPITEVAAGDQVWKLSLDGIPAGMYILEVHSDRQQWREKIVVR